MKHALCRRAMTAARRTLLVGQQLEPRLALSGAALIDWMPDDGNDASIVSELGPRSAGDDYLSAARYVAMASTITQLDGWVGAATPATRINSRWM